MNGYVNDQTDVMQRKQRLETLQNARQWQPSDTVEAARLDSQINTVRGVLRLFEYQSASCW